MYDRWSPEDDFAHQDAAHAAKQEHGCGNCPDIQACRDEGVCIQHMEIVEPDTGTKL